MTNGPRGFAVSPILGGTGQNVKVVEAMAHGLAVIGLRERAEVSPIRHGINGLVADRAEEFADHVLRLGQDRALRRRLGCAARDTITTEYGPHQLAESLGALAG